MILHFIKDIFTYLPFAVLAVTLLTFVWPCRFGRLKSLAIIGWLLFCASKFVCFRHFGGDVFYPNLPETLLWFWNWAYLGLLILCPLSLFWWHRSRRWLLPVLAWALAAYGVWCGVKPPDVVEYEFTFDGLPEELNGYRIVHLSDIHVSPGATRWRTERIVELANDIHADLICLTGDITDGKVELRLNDVEPLKHLRAKDGLCASTGNHEFYYGWKQWKKAYAKLGIHFLANECAFPRPSLAVAGINDEAAVWTNGRRNVQDVEADARKAFAAARHSEFRILLQHRPGGAPVNVKQLGVRLQLSGHTHGGFMPVLDEIVRRNNSGYVRGVYEIGKSILFVNSGAGQWAGFPVRFCDPAEIAVITLRKK